MEKKEEVLALALLFLVFLPAVMHAVEAGPRPDLTTGGPEATLLFHRGLDLHQEAVAGDEEAVDEALLIFEDLHERFPNEARAMAFLGNLYALKARDAIFYKKTGWLKRAFSAMDGAVAMSPEDPHVRAVRAINSYQIPGFLGRGAVAEEDFSTLLAWTEEKPERFSNGLLKFVYFHAGRYFAEEFPERAQELFDKALLLPEESVSNQEITRELSEIRR